MNQKIKQMCSKLGKYFCADLYEAIVDLDRKLRIVQSDVKVTVDELKELNAKLCEVGEKANEERAKSMSESNVVSHDESLVQFRDGFLVCDELLSTFAEKLSTFVYQFPEERILSAVSDIVMHGRTQGQAAVLMSNQLAEQFAEGGKCDPVYLQGRLYELLSFVKRYEPETDYGLRLRNKTGKNIQDYMFSPSKGEAYSLYRHTSLGNDVGKKHVVQSCVFPGIQYGNMVLMRAVVKCE